MSITGLTLRPGEVRLSLPYPVSANRMYRAGKGRVYKSDAYKTWQAEAHVAWLQQKNQLSVKRVDGRYLLLLEATPPDQRNRDIDNLVKSVSDFLQAVGVISNDHLSKRIILDWTDDPSAKAGVVATVYPIAVGTGQGTEAEA